MFNMLGIDALHITITGSYLLLLHWNSFFYLKEDFLSPVESLSEVIVFVLNRTRHSLKYKSYPWITIWEASLGNLLLWSVTKKQKYICMTTKLFQVCSSLCDLTSVFFYVRHKGSKNLYFVCFFMCRHRGSEKLLTSSKEVRG